MIKNVRIVGEIERLVSPSVDTFRRYTSSAGARPVIVSGELTGSKALNWSAQHLHTTMGEQKLQVYVSLTGTFPGGDGPYDETKYRLVEMKLGECIDRMSGNDQFAPILGRGERCYVYQSPASAFSEISTDLAKPRFVPDFSSVMQNFWVSGTGNVTPPHLDLAENLLVQISGKKEVLLWSPADVDRLYINPLGRKHSRQSRIDLMNFDEDSFPAFREARAWAGVLDAGDMIYIPWGWIHFVLTRSFSVSANYWWPLAEEAGGPLAQQWKMILLQCLFPIRKIRPEIRALLLSHLKHTFGDWFHSASEHGVKSA